MLWYTFVKEYLCFFGHHIELTFKQEVFMKKRYTILGILMMIMILALMACSTNNEQEGSTLPELSTDENAQMEDTKEPSVKDLMKEFDTLVSKEGVQLIEIAKFMEENIEAVTPEDTSNMIIQFEELQLSKKPELEEKYLPEEIQIGFQEAFVEEQNVNNPDDFKDAGTKQLVQESQDNGFKVEQAEGYFFPIIDYSFYQKFSSNATPDMKEYIRIMTEESDKVYAKDAALMIGWDEVINRALSSEEFLKHYADSKKAPYIQSLYERYEVTAMFGMNNTPLFEYDSDTMNEDARKAYEEILAKNSNSEFLKKLSSFMDMVKKNDFKLTEEVDQYRKENSTQGTVSADSDKYYVAGIDDAAEFDETFLMLQQAVADNDQATVAEYIAYPIRVNIDGNKVEIKNEKEFIEKYDKIMTDPVKEAFINQKIEEVFVNYQGIMVGSGEIWFTQLAGTKHKFSIYGINN